ncbi:MAG: cobalamin biosynthesis protein [Clostridia bacterium]|nr:cobalamin biosynthesis protein [Clostridia bacterium]
MKIDMLSFTEAGYEMAQTIRNALEERPLLNPGESPRLTVTVSRCNQPLSLGEWTGQMFDQTDALVYVGAAGIAVPAIAPFVKSKVTDPAVVVVDEGGSFAIPVLSGHLGGANDLARAIAERIGATAVITTATDVNHVFAIDAWTRRQGLVIQNTEKIKTISSALLAGETVYIATEWPIAGDAPKGVVVEDLNRSVEGEMRPLRVAPHILITNRRDAAKAYPDALIAVPKNVVLGAGCKRNVLPVSFELLLTQLLGELDLLEDAIDAVASIDIKKDEPGLLAFCTVHDWPLITYSAARLKEAEGEFTASFFVRNVTGVDNVCERSASLLSGGPLLKEKTTGNGVTMAAAEKPTALTWNSAPLENYE